jgi:hypothetical protein
MRTAEKNKKRRGKMKNKIGIGIYALCLFAGLASATDITVSSITGDVTHPVLGGEPLYVSNSPFLVTSSPVEWQTGSSYRYTYVSQDGIEQVTRGWDELNPKLQSLVIYGLNSASIGGGIRAYSNLEDYTNPNGINVMSYGSCVLNPSEISCVNKDTKYFAVSESETIFPVKNCIRGLVTDASGKVSCAPETTTTGFTGKCPGDYDLVIKNGLITGCQKARGWR